MTLDSDATPPMPHDIGHLLRHLRERWGWFAAFGVLTLFLGIVSLGVAGVATLVSVYMIAFFMILIGGIEITIGVNAHKWSNRIIVVLVGLLYIVAGSFALANPLTGAVGFTLMLGAALTATGVARIVFATRLPEGPKWYVAAAGLVTVLLGVFIVAGWPENSRYVLGVFLGVDMIMYGASWLNFALFLRLRATHAH
ncbi:MAG: HdeD family acid-resistance protein [Methylocystis sp.]